MPVRQIRSISCQTGDFRTCSFARIASVFFFRATRVYIARNVPRHGVCPSLYRTTLRYSTLRHSKLGDSVITNYSELNKERISLCHTAVQTRMFARHSGLEVLGDQDPPPKPRQECPVPSTVVVSRSSCGEIVVSLNSNPQTKNS